MFGVPLSSSQFFLQDHLISIEQLLKLRDEFINGIYLLNFILSLFNYCLLIFCNSTCSYFCLVIESQLCFTSSTISSSRLLVCVSHSVYEIDIVYVQSNPQTIGLHDANYWNQNYWVGHILMSLWIFGSLYYLGNFKPAKKGGRIMEQTHTSIYDFSNSTFV